MTDQTGSFIWYELMTPDPDAAAAFYRAVIGWSAAPFGDAGDAAPGGYQVFRTRAGEGVAGLMQPPPEAEGMPPAWFGYVGVSDPDAVAATTSAKGGMVHVPPTDIPGVGRFAMLADPTGATLYVMRGNSDEDSAAFRPGVDGHGAWAELSTTDPDAALAFYADLFGWRKDGGMPMGAMGEYSFVKRGNAADDEIAFGAAMRGGDGMPPHWRYYFALDGIAAAADRIAEAGGTVVHGPSEVPGGSHIVIATDPQGAMFGLVGKAEG